MRTTDRTFLTIRTIAHAARNMRRDLASLTFTQWRADYLAVRELRVRREMDRLAGELRRSVALNPDDFDGREPLWIRRETLRASLSA